MKYIICAVFIFFILLNIANAQVVISEIAWMGSNNGGTSGQDANDEWIELYNSDSKEIDLLGWVLIADDESPSITLEGIIDGGGYFLLERSDDNSVPSVSANLFYTGALSNSGEILTIKNSEGVVIDTVNGIEGWQNIGGNNETKETAQLISGVWITALPTPGKANFDNSSENENTVENNSENQNENSQNQSVETGGSSSFFVEPQIFADAGDNRSVIVGADSLFEGKAFGLLKKPLENARYIWNFGNGETKEGQNVLYYYQYPGEYVVILTVSSGEYSATDRIIVNARKADIVISKVEDNFIEIHNKSEKEINLSWWQIRSGDKKFMIPKDTIILPNKKLIFSADTVKLGVFIKEDISLLYPNGEEAVLFFDIVIPQKTITTETFTANSLPPQQSLQQQQMAKEAVEQEEKIKEEQVEFDTDKISQNIAQTATVLSSINNKARDSKIYKWLLAVFGIIVVSAGIIIYVSGKRELGDDIEIIE